MTFWPPGASKYDTETLARMRALWEHAPDLSAARIAEMFPNMTKDVVKGLARRGKWAPRREPAPELITTMRRLDAIHARMDAVLAETKVLVGSREPAA